MANNRELSQFASFVEVGISSIGFTTSVGIGTTNPQFDLDVAGDINFTGTFYQGGTQFIASRWSATGSDIYRLSKVGINTSIVSSALTVNGDVYVSGVVTATSINVSGISTLGITSATNLTSQSLVVSGISTLGITSATNLTSQSLVVSGISTLGITSATNLTSQSLVVSGISTLGITSATNLTSQSLVVSGISTFTNGPILVGTATSTGTASQPLQVTGGAYVSGNIGIGTANPQDKLEINSLNNTDVKLRLANSASSFNNFSIIRSIRISDSQSALEFQVNQFAGIKTYFSIDHEGLVSVGQASASSQLVVKGNSGNQGGNFTPQSILNIYSNTALAADTGGSITLGGVFNSSSTIRAFGVIKGYKENATDSNSQGYLSFLTNTGSSISEALRITSAGNLLIGTATSTGTASQPLQVTGGAYVSGSFGIGTTNPTSKLQLAGSLSAYNSTSTEGAMAEAFSEIVSQPINLAGGASLDVGTIPVTNDNNWRAIVRGTFSNNYEGGGLTPPSFNLELNSTQNTIPCGGTSITVSRNTSTNRLKFTNNNATFRVTFTGTIEIIVNNQSGQPVNSITTIGKVGIGTANPQYKLDVIGDTRVTGSITSGSLNVSGSTTLSGTATINRVSISTVGVNTTLQTGIVYVYLTGVTELTLPSSPSVGDTLKIINRSGITTAVVIRNGSNIMSFDEDIELDELDGSFNFVYANSSEGWIVSR